jgi:hypothetical protein
MTGAFLKASYFLRLETVVTQRVIRIGTAAACLGLMSSGLLPASASAAPAKPTAANTVKDLSKQIEVVVGGRLRPAGAGQATVGVSVWNPSNRAVVGPVFLVIDGSGLDDVAVENREEAPAVGNGVYEIVPAGKILLGNAMSPQLEVTFTTPEKFSQEQANEFALAARVFARLGEAPVSPNAADADFATRGKSYDQAELNRVMNIQEKYTPDLVQKQGVLATSIGENAQGKLTIRLFTETRAEAKKLPGQIEGVAVEVKPIPGGFNSDAASNTVTYVDGVAKTKATREAERAAAATQADEDEEEQPTDPTLYFDRPVPIGVSSFNAVDECAAGTLGCRCIDHSGKLYAISNTHVYARLSKASRGESIVQPSQGDNNCVTDEPQNVIGTLVDYVSWNFDTSLPVPLNITDCALMEVASVVNSKGETVPAVGFATPSNGYGVPSKNILRTNRIGLQVQKYGRTTVYTRGHTVGLNVLLPIDDNTGNLVTFFRMDEYAGTLPSTDLSNPGDSGSLIVTVDDRRPVSLLFAGGGGTTLGNPIGLVLDRFNVQIDDGTRSDATTDVDYPGVSGRQGIVIGNLGQDDRAYLPPELWGRIKNPQVGLIPVEPLTTATP